MSGCSLFFFWYIVAALFSSLLQRKHPINLWKMLSEDTIFDSLSPLNSAGDDHFAMKLEAFIGHDSDKATSEEADNMNQPLSMSPNHNKRKLSPRRREGSTAGATKKGKHQVSNELSKAKGKEEPKGKEERVKELLKRKSVTEILKILRDRVNRRIKIDQSADMEACIFLMKFVMENKLYDFFSQIVDSLNQIKRKWPARADLQNIKKKIKEMEDVERDKKRQGMGGPNMVVADEMKLRLEGIEEEIITSDKERPKDSKKAKNLEAIFIDEGVSVETLREKLSYDFPWLVLGETETNKPTGNEDQGSLQTRKIYTAKDVEDFEKKIAMDNKEVRVSDFHGLEEAIGTAERDIPDCLEHIAKKIEKARGTQTEFVYKNIQLLVCAAVKEMEDQPLEQLNEVSLLKWGVTLKMAKKINFQVEFAETQFKKNLYAYFCFLNSKSGMT
ncbi:hypothetical protein REPUB_Repub02eG0221900 [Reevesia pubescens]